MANQPELYVGKKQPEKIVQQYRAANGKGKPVKWLHAQVRMLKQFIGGFQGKENQVEAGKRCNQETGHQDCNGVGQYQFNHKVKG